jgi:hypothetical protein
VVAAVVVLLMAIVARPPADLLDGVPDGTQVITVSSRDHVEGDIDYGVAVPAGGAHNVSWLNCGIYDTEVPTENAVHSLEHGAVWLTYNPSLVAASDVDALVSEGRRRSSRVIVSPVPDQETPVMATSWGHQLELDNGTDTRIRQYVNEFTKPEYSPEPGATCAGGIGNPA